jgi:hypothetical protein
MSLDQLPTEILLQVAARLPRWPKLGQLSKHFNQSITDKNSICFSRFKHFNYIVPLHDAFMHYKNIILSGYYDIFTFNPNYVLIFKSACDSGNEKIIKFLIAHTCVDTYVDADWAIIRESEYVHIDIVIFLLEDPRVDPGAYDNWPIRDAAVNAHADIVRLLLDDSGVDPCAKDNAIQKASANGHHRVVKLSY